MFWDGPLTPTAAHNRAGMDKMSSSKQGLKPGATAPRSGQYVQRGPRGGPVREVTVTRGKPMPPTPKPHMDYVLIDPTRNKSGKP